MLSAPVVLAGQLLAVALACGLNLYATVALLGLSSRLGIVTHLPPGMRGLENGVIIGLAVGLFFLEFVVDRVPVLDAAWEAIHTLIRPAAAGLLAFLALHETSLSLQFAGAVAAAAIAFATHTAKSGIRLILAARSRATLQRQSRTRLLVCIAEDVVAIAVALTALLYPTAASIVVAVAVALLLVAGPRLWRAALLGLRALMARPRGFFGSRGWRSRTQLPRSLRDAVPIEPLGRSPARATPAAVTGIPGVGAYRNGWLVFTCDGPRFLYRSLFRTRSLPLPHAADVTVQRGLMTDCLDVRINSGSAQQFTIYLLKDGAPAHVAAAELLSETR